MSHDVEPELEDVAPPPALLEDCFDCGGAGRVPIWVGGVRLGSDVCPTCWGSGQQRSGLVLGENYDPVEHRRKGHEIANAIHGENANGSS